jgi:hypothetical protein
MREQERRHCQRYQMNYSIIVSSPRAIASEEGWHYGEILDAGREGLRMRVNDFGSLSVGTRLQLICQPATNHEPNNKCMPVPIEGTVVWENASTNEFALSYIH